MDSPLSRISTSVEDFDDFDTPGFLLRALEDALNSLQYDQALVVQSQMAGQINNSLLELEKIIPELESSLKQLRESYKQLRNDIVPEIVANLKQSATIIKEITRYMKKHHPVEYAKSRDKVLNRITDEDQDTDLFQ